MKRSLALFVLTFVWINFAVASEIRLTVGDSITVNANESVRVSCEQGKTPELDCEAETAGIAMQWRKCIQKEPKMDCFEKNWKTFKKDYPNCSIATCVVACFEAYGVDQEYCIKRCANERN